MSDLIRIAAAIGLIANTITIWIIGSGAVVFSHPEWSIERAVFRLVLNAGLMALACYFI